VPKARVYVETKVTRDWWARRQRFDLFVSRAVLAEAGRGSAEAAARRLEALRGIPNLRFGREVATLVRRLMRSGVLPPQARLDAAHVAVAAVNGMDFLVTWNLRHLANAALRGKIERGEPQTKGVLRLASGYVLLPGLRPGGRLDGENLIQTVNIFRPSRLLGSLSGGRYRDADHMHTGGTHGAAIMTRRDRIVEEVRKHRTAIAREYGNDIDAIIAAFQREDAADATRPTMSFPPKRLAKSASRPRLATARRPKRLHPTAAPKKAASGRG
jgi:hypothetical protein